MVPAQRLSRWRHKPILSALQVSALTNRGRAPQYPNEFYQLFLVYSCCLICLAVVCTGRLALGSSDETLALPICGGGPDRVRVYIVVPLVHCDTSSMLRNIEYVAVYCGTLQYMEYNVVH